VQIRPIDAGLLTSQCLFAPCVALAKYSLSFVEPDKEGKEDDSGY
jgi:hypothetical protein